MNKGTWKFLCRVLPRAGMAQVNRLREKEGEPDGGIIDIVIAAGVIVLYCASKLSSEGTLLMISCDPPEA